MIEQGVQSHYVALDARVVETRVKVFGELGGNVCSSTQEKLANLCMLFLSRQKKRCQSGQCLFIDVGTTIQKFLHNIQVLRISSYCVHERCSFLLIFVIDKSLVIQQVLNQFEVTFLAGHHEGCLSFVGLLRVDICAGLDQQLCALNGVVEFVSGAAFNRGPQRYIERLLWDYIVMTSQNLLHLICIALCRALF